MRSPWNTSCFLYWYSEITIILKICRKRISNIKPQFINFMQNTFVLASKYVCLFSKKLFRCPQRKQNESQDFLVYNFQFRIFKFAVSSIRGIFFRYQWYRIMIPYHTKLKLFDIYISVIQPVNWSQTGKFEIEKTFQRLHHLYHKVKLKRKNKDLCGHFAQFWQKNSET